jgi:RES domain-containing protein
MRVCARCFDDADLQEWIKAENGDPGCDFCGRRDAPTADFVNLARYINECLMKVWGHAVEQLPYESAEGGYLGNTWTTWELLYEEIGLGLPRDNARDLRQALAREVSDEVWCDYDWLTLDEDDALRTSWESFCQIVKHERRYFFGALEQDPQDRDHFVPAVLLDRIAGLASGFDLIKTYSAGDRVYRARIAANRRLTTAAELGPPPAEFALQSNRMNPPGVPMLYAAEAPATAIQELQSAKACYVGTFQLLRDAIVLDLAELPDVPGILANADRDERLALTFLHHFQSAISTPVARDERTHVDYIPTQVVTEYFRQHGVGEIQIDGIRYPSAVHRGGRNIVLFATQKDLEGAVAPKAWDKTKPWLRLVRARRAPAPPRRR